LGMFETLQGALNIAGNGYVDGFLDVVPGDGEATVSGTFPVFANGI
jgi:hypothetical protein